MWLWIWPDETVSFDKPWNDQLKKGRGVKVFWRGERAADPTGVIFTWPFWLVSLSINLPIMCTINRGHDEKQWIATFKKLEPDNVWYFCLKNVSMYQRVLTGLVKIYQDVLFSWIGPDEIVILQTRNQLRIRREIKVLGSNSGRFCRYCGFTSHYSFF